MKVIVEYIGAYDGWLTWFYVDKPDELFFRIDNLKVIDYCRPKDLGPVYFEVEGNRYFKNLIEITEEEFYKNYVPQIKE